MPRVWGGNSFLCSLACKWSPSSPGGVKTSWVSSLSIWCSSMFFPRFCRPTRGWCRPEPAVQASCKSCVSGGRVRPLMLKIVQNMDRRAIARSLATQAVKENRPLDWFEQLYRKAESENVPIPWADLVPNPNVVALLDERGINGAGRLALKIGSGLEDDSEYLDSLGFKVVAFDISSTAIRLARERFPISRVDYVIADLFQLPRDWLGKFDFVWESYTLQVLP